MNDTKSQVDQLGDDISNDIHQIEKSQTNVQGHVDRFEQKVKKGMFALEAKLDRAIEHTRQICDNVPKLVPIQDPS